VPYALTLSKSAFYKTVYLFSVHWISKQSAIISLYEFKCFFFIITEVKCVNWAVRAEYLNAGQVNLNL
jgi:hypothetical protein